MAHHTENCRIGSAIAYAVGRSPLVLANEARGLDAARIAFYTAPKAYTPMMEASGFAVEAKRIRTAFADRDHEAMIAAVSDEMRDAIGVAGTAEQVAAGIKRRAGDFDHVGLYSPSFTMTAERVRENTLALVDAGAAALAAAG